MPIDHLFCENRRTGGRIGEDGLMALLHILLPEVAQKFFTLIGQATCGVALFAMGLLLSGQVPCEHPVPGERHLQEPASAGRDVGIRLAAWRGRVVPPRDDLLGALPTASMTAMFAVQYQVYTNDSNATIVVSTVFYVVSLGAIIALTS